MHYYPDSAIEKAISELIQEEGFANDLIDTFWIKLNTYTDEELKRGFSK